MNVRDKFFGDPLKKVNTFSVWVAFAAMAGWAGHSVTSPVDNKPGSPAPRYVATPAEVEFIADGQRSSLKTVIHTDTVTGRTWFLVLSTNSFWKELPRPGTP